MALKDIRLIRDITAVVNGATHELKAGWQKVEQEVADHWFVKGNTDTNGSSDATPDMRDAQIVELNGQIGALKDQVAAANASAQSAQVNEQKVTDLQTQLDAMTAARDNLLSENTALTAKVADLQATIDLSAAPSDPAPAVDTAAKAKK